MNKRLENNEKDKALEYIKTKLFCRLGVSEIDGVGVFAYKDIPKGIDPFEPYEEYGHLFITEEQSQDIDDATLGIFQQQFFSPDGATFAQLDDRTYFPQYLNDSTLPNTVFDVTCKSGIRTTAFIKAGTELTTSYAQTKTILEKEMRKHTEQTK